MSQPQASEGKPPTHKINTKGGWGHFGGQIAYIYIIANTKVWNNHAFISRFIYTHLELNEIDTSYTFDIII